MDLPTSMESVGAPSPPWRTYSGKRVVVHALAGSYAAKRSAAELQEAEKTIEALEKILEPAATLRGSPVQIFLTDPVANIPASLLLDRQPDGSPDWQAGSANSETLVRIVQPEAPGEPITVPLTTLLVARWFGTKVSSAVLFLTGLAGVVAARIGSGPAIQEANEWVREAQKSGQSVSLFSQVASESLAVGSTEHAQSNVENRAAASFVSFLLEEYGAPALRLFLSSYDPERRDQAATAAYQRPLGTLEENWLARVQRSARRSSAFRTFFRQLGPLIRPYWVRQVEVLGYMVLGLSYNLILPISSKYLIDTVIPSGNVGTLALFILALLAIYVFNTLTQSRRAYVNSWINQRILLDLQEQMFKHLQFLSHQFYTNAKVGDIMSRLSNDLQIVQQAMSQVVGVGIFMGLNAVVAAIAICFLSPLLGVLVLLIVPLFGLTYLLLGKRYEKASVKKSELIGAATAAEQETLSAHAVIKAFGLEERAISTYHSRLTALLRASLRLIVVATLFETSLGLAVTLGQLTVLGVGGYLVIHKQISVGTLLAFIGLLPALFVPVAALSSVGQTVQAASGSMARINELLDEPIEIADQAGAEALPSLSREIRLENLSFSYDGARPILRDLDLTIPAGSHVAIVGPSGSGKSTVVSLLLRFWDPQQGRVLWDGHDLREGTLSSLRSQIGIVFQDTFIFDTTLRENIAIGRVAASDADITAAAKAARLDSYIAALPAGFDTVLGERGVRMSGGQRQRLAIARALLRDPGILILDEATSALDAKTESEILETLGTLTHGRTTISITHRLSLAAAADYIMVLDQGHLVEQGTHPELVKAGGLYQRLYEEQTGYVTGVTRSEGGAARLKTIPLFSQLRGEALGRLAQLLLPERFSAGEDVVVQQSPGDKLFVINRGQVEVLVKDGAGERRINILNDGDYFGEMALISNEPRTATVRTTMPSELYSLAQADFRTLLEQEPPFRKMIAEAMAERRAALVTANSALTTGV